MTVGESVRTRISGATGVLQAVIGRRTPFTSTAQKRHPPNGTQILVVAQRGDVDANGGGRVQNGGALFHVEDGIVDFQVDHRMTPLRG